MWLLGILGSNFLAAINILPPERLYLTCIVQATLAGSSGVAHLRNFLQAIFAEKYELKNWDSYVCDFFDVEFYLGFSAVWRQRLQFGWLGLPDIGSEKVANVARRWTGCK